MAKNHVNMRSRLSGSFVIVASCAFLYIASGYPIGTIANIGPGLFPTALACVTLLLGIYLTVVGDKEGVAEIEASIFYQVALVTVSILAFYFLLDYLGLAITVFTSSFVYLVYFRSLPFRYKFLVALGTSVFCHVIFIEMIGLQVRHFP